MGAITSPRISGSFSLSALTSNTPSGVAPTGTVGANGAVTLGTALAKTYTGGIFLRFPAGALFSGSAAGSYWCVMSSTTVGTAFNNTLTDPPSAPASTTAIVDAGPGAYTGVTGDVTVASFAVPGGFLGPNGSIRMNNENSYNTTAGNKVFKYVFGGVTLVTIARSSSGGHDSFTTRFRNVGSQAINTTSTASESVAATALSHIVTAINTGVSQTFSFSVNIAVATDFAVVESTCLELIQGF